MRMTLTWPVLLCVLSGAATRAIAQPVIEPDRHIPLVQQRTAPQHETDAACALDGPLGLLLWKESGGGTLTSTHCHLATTQDGGVTWQSLPPLPRPPGRQASPALVAAGNGRFHYLSVYPALFGFHQLRLETADLSSGSLVWVRNLVLPGGHTAILYPDLACDRGTGAVHVTYSHYDDIENGLASPSRIRYLRSTDGGDTWSTPVVLSSERSDRSRVALGPDGEVYVAWVDAEAEQVRLRRSDDGGLTFGPERLVAPFLDNRNTGMYDWVVPGLTPHPVYTADMKVPDVPRLVVDHSSGPQRGRVYLAWTDHASGVAGPRTGESEEVEPNGSPATATLVPIGHDLNGFCPNVDLGGDFDLWAFDGVAGQSVQIVGDVVWSPTPDFVETKLYVMYCQSPTGDLTQIARTNSVRQPTDGSPPAYAMRPLLLTLPSTGRYYIAMTSAGPYSIGYTLRLREWQVDAASVARDQRDVVLLSSATRGDTWGAKVRVGDAPHFFDESHPELAIDPQGRVHMTWLDRRAEPACGSLTDQYWAYSLDGGLSFSASRRLSSASTLRTEPGSPRLAQFHGERNALAVGDGFLHAFWADRRVFQLPLPETGTDIWGTRVRLDQLTSTSVARFEVAPSETGVRVAWRVHDARGLVSVEVEREDVLSPGFAPLEEQEPDGTLEGEHVLMDGAAQPGRTYRYRLALWFTDGRRLHEGPLEATAPERRLTLAWEQPTPNPTARHTRLALSMPRQGHAAVEVYDVAGQRVGRVHDGPLAAGRHAWQWPQPGRSAAPGIYLVRAEALGETRATRVIVTR